MGVTALALDSSQRDYDGEKQQREARIKELEIRVGELSAQIRTTSHRKEQFGAAVDELQGESDRLRRERDELKSNLSKANGRLRDLEDSRQDRLKRFGQHVPKVLQRVQEACRRGLFHAEPMGPVGAFLSLRSPSHALPVEMALSRTITAWCVTDHHDERQLSKIFTEVFPKNMTKPQIITAQFQVSISLPPVCLQILVFKQFQFPFFQNSLYDTSNGVSV